MNEDVFAMIDTLKARLEDVRQVVESASGPLTGYAQRLDKIDDQIYLLQVDMERVIAQQGSDAEAQASADQASGSEVQAQAPAESAAAAEKPASSEESEKKDILSDDMKENLADAGRALGNIYRDGMEVISRNKGVISEFTGAMDDIKGAFNVKGKFRK